MSFMKKIHREPYSGISPRRPDLSQAGQTVLVTGGAQGVGYSIVKAFAQAGADNIIIASRKLESLEDAITRMKADVPEYSGRLVTYICDVGDLESIAKLWESIHEDGFLVDVLVLNAAKAATSGRLVDTNLVAIWQEFETNVRGNIDFAQRFFKQNAISPNGRRKVLLNVSSFVIHDFKTTSGMPNYPLTKSAGTLAIQQIAKDVAAEDTQILSFNPGGIYTDAARRAGVAKEAYPWDHDDLPGSFAVWASSAEAKFLHGRFVHASWDVEELRTGTVASRILEDESFLTVGVPGLDASAAIAVL